MFKKEIFILILLTSCVIKQNPAIVEKGTKNNIINNISEEENSYNFENPYSSYPITQNNTDVDINYDNKIKYSSINKENKEIANTHTVVYGDTVYNISKKYNILQDDLIKWNNIINNNISIGQILYLKDPILSNNDKSIAKDVPRNVNNSNYNIFNNLNKPSSTKTKTYDGILWTSPTNSNIINYYGGKNKGIDFGGDIDSPIFAAADGKVVYSGHDLKGYGNLIIIQHTPVYLTAYGNNNSLLLKQGDKVLRGQKIATMGNSDSSNIKLHFELRKNGKPINPINIIPF